MEMLSGNHSKQRNFTVFLREWFKKLQYKNEKIIIHAMNKKERIKFNLKSTIKKPIKDKIENI